MGVRANGVSRWKSRGYAILLVAALPSVCATVAVSVSADAREHRAPMRGTIGLDPMAMDRLVVPGDDFYGYANGAWTRSHTFSPDQTYIGARADLIQQRKDRIRAIVEAAASNPSSSQVAGVVGPFFASYMDEQGIDAAGLKPIAQDLAQVRAIDDYPALFKIFAQAPLLGIDAPIRSSVFYDFHNPGWMRFTIEPGGLGLSSRDAYLDTGEAAVKRRQSYQAYVADMLRLGGRDDPEAKAERILALETRLARTHWVGADAYNFLKTANSLPVSQLAGLTPDFDWSAFLHAAGAQDIDTVIVKQPSAMAPLIAEIRRTSLDDWRAWLEFHLLADNAAMLSRPFTARAFAFEKQATGQEVAAPRWQQGVSLVEGYFGQAVGRLYVERWFPERNKRAVATIFGNITAEMRSRIVKAAWMSGTTRAEALKKIDTLVVKIGYPDRWPDYSAIRATPSDFYGNLRAARAFAWADRMRRIARPLDRAAWQTTPQSSGAAANPNLNEITVPAGALEPPYFDIDADPAVNYGAIGGVLGHELSHMFDLLGRQMDATGALRDWWAPADARRYTAIADRVEQEYSSLEALPGTRIDGKFTLNENIADISGLSIALGAYHRSVNGKPQPVRAGFSGDQRFFLGWAQMRAGKMRDQTLRAALKQDPHAPDPFRVNGVVPNIDGWYAAFNVKPTNRLYRAPADRAKFW